MSTLYKRLFNYIQSTRLSGSEVKNIPPAARRLYRGSCGCCFNIQHTEPQTTEGEPEHYSRSQKANSNRDLIYWHTNKQEVRPRMRMSSAICAAVPPSQPPVFICELQGCVCIFRMK